MLHAEIEGRHVGVLGVVADSGDRLISQVQLRHVDELIQKNAEAGKKQKYLEIIHWALKGPLI